MSDKITVWALGGVGCKVASRLRKHAIAGDGVVPGLEYIYIDTSESEVSYIPSSADLDLVTNTTGLKGSGGDRGHNYPACDEQVPGIVSNRHTPGNINFLIASTGAGSGSTLMYVVARELIEQGEAVVCFISNTTDAQTRTHNAIASMSTMDDLAHTMGVNLPAFIYDTTETPSFDHNDDRMVSDIERTAAMLCTSVVGVDDMDRRVALNPCASGHSEVVEPGLKALMFFTGETYDEHALIISALTLVDPGKSDNIGTNAPFIFGGVLSTEFKKAFFTKQDVSAISLLVSDTALNSWIDEMNSKLETQLKSRDRSYKRGRIEMSTKAKSRKLGSGFIA